MPRRECQARLLSGISCVSSELRRSCWCGSRNEGRRGCCWLAWSGRRCSSGNGCCCRAWCGRRCEGCCGGRSNGSHDASAGCCSGHRYSTGDRCCCGSMSGGRSERRCRCFGGGRCGCRNRGRFGGKHSPGRPEDGNQPRRSQKPTGKRHNAERRDHRKERDLGTNEGRHTVYEETSRVTFWGRSFSNAGERSCVVKSSSHKSIRGPCADTQASRWAGDGRRTVSARR